MGLMKSFVKLGYLLGTVLSMARNSSRFYRKHPHFLSRGLSPRMALLFGGVVLGCAPTWAQEGESVAHLRMVFAGDAMVHLPQLQSGLQSDGKTYEFYESFQYIQSWLQAADVAVVNLEENVSAQGPYLGYPTFRAPSTWVEALARAGFDVFATANNHAYDHFTPGVYETWATLEKWSVQHTGTFRNQQTRLLETPLLLDRYVGRHHFRIALLNYTLLSNRRALDPALINQVKLTQVQEDLSRARLFHPDAIVVFLHGGTEYERTENAVQRKWAQWLAQQGVHAIVGAHPHVVQPIRFLQGLTGWVPVAYSLGNLISSQRDPYTDVGLLLQLEFTKDLQGTRVSAVKYEPVWRWIDVQPNGHQRFVVLPESRVSDPEVGLSPKKLQQVLETIRHVRKKLNPLNPQASAFFVPPKNHSPGTPGTLPEEMEGKVFPTHEDFTKKNRLSWWSRVLHLVVDVVLRGKRSDQWVESVKRAQCQGPPHERGGQDVVSISALLVKWLWPWDCKVHAW